MTLPSLVLGIPLIGLLLEYVRPLSDHSIALAHPAVAFSSAGYRQEGEGYLVGPMRAGSPTRIGSSGRLDHHESGPVPAMPILEGPQVLSSCSEYLASP